MSFSVKFDYTPHVDQILQIRNPLGPKETFYRTNQAYMYNNQGFKCLCDRG
jgi:hypothetical protein